jgi:Putative peptidoglycan binding domain
MAEHTASPAAAQQATGKRPGRRPPAALLGTGALALAGLGAGLAWWLAPPRGQAAASSTGSPATAPVVRTDLTNAVQVTGALGYAGSYSIANQQPGTAYTALPAPGQVIRRGQRLYEVDGAPVCLFYGQRPEWRDLAVGVAGGPDVAQLDANLIALGYATAARLTVSGTYTDATAAAVGQWQAATGQPVTGTVAAGQIAYAPGPVRVTAVAAQLGGAPQPGAQVLTATSPVPQVQASLPVSQEYLVKTGDRVEVSLPGGTAAPGVVTGVGAVASVPASGAGSGPAPQPAQAPAGGSGATVALTVRLTRLPGSVARLDQAPVTVNVTSAQARGVLAVPVQALVALAGGGYAVQVMHGRAGHLVAVRTGLFGATLVQVTGTGLAAGDRVAVPSP